MNSMIFALRPLDILYRVVMKVRRALYRFGRFKVHDLGVPVISVGNLTTGGTGKTPLVEWIARELAQTGRRVCLLTRGYGRSSRGRVVVSDGIEILSDVNIAGDEPLLLAERLKGLAAVICDTDRVSAARWAVKNLRSDLFILDDGFQHLRVARDLNILTIDATNPWGNRRSPAGTILRESRSEIKRADCVVITRADDPKTTEALHQEIAANTGAPVFRSRMRLLELRPIQGKVEGSVIAAQEIKAGPVAAFSGIGNPDSFFSLLRRSGYQLSHRRAFRDHHSYTQGDIDLVVRESVKQGAQILLTTAKDEVKLRSLMFELPCYAVDISIEIENHAEFRALIEKALIRKA